MQAADALDDLHYSDWMDLTANLLQQHALSHARNRGRTKPSVKEDISEGLARLPSHLQARLFERVTGGHTASQYNSLTNVGLLLDLLPSEHHAAVVATAITPTKALTLPRGLYPLPFIQSLAHLPASPPSLLSLTLHCQGPYSYKVGMPRPEGTPVQHAATALATALRRHTTLTSLRFDTFDRADSLTRISPALATLTALHTLCLDAVLHADALPAMKSAFASMPSLQRLQLAISAQSNPGRCRQGAAGGQNDAFDLDKDAPLQHQLAALLSAATALTSLDVLMHTRPSRSHTSMAVPPLSLPRLQHLRINSDSAADACSAILSRLAAPLSTLHIEAPLSGESDLQSCPARPHLWPALGRFAQLRSLEVMQQGGPKDAAQERALLEAASAALVPLTCLQELALRAGLRLLHCLVRQLLAADASQADGLRRLKLEILIGRDHEADLWPPWRSLLGHISRLQQLQDLHIHSGSFSGTISTSADAEEHLGLAALQPLTQLTSLHVAGWRSCLGRHEDCEALAGMRELRSVAVERFAACMPAAVKAHAVCALGALPSLSQLMLRPGDPLAGGAFLAVFAKCAAEAPWPALRWLGLCVVLESDAAVAIVGAVAGFPALRELVFGGRFVDSQHARAHLIAQQAGVELSVGWDGSRFEWKSAWR